MYRVCNLANRLIMHYNYIRHGTAKYPSPRVNTVRPVFAVGILVTATAVIIITSTCSLAHSHCANPTCRPLCPSGRTSATIYSSSILPNLATTPSHHSPTDSAPTAGSRSVASAFAPRPTVPTVSSYTLPLAALHGSSTHTHNTLDFLSPYPPPRAASDVLAPSHRDVPSPPPRVRPMTQMSNSD